MVKAEGRNRPAGPDAAIQEAASELPSRHGTLLAEPKPDLIEVTPAMLEAGVARWREFLFGQDEP
jgi:hypothetical protein